jgi:hypothetical protein
MGEPNESDLPHYREARSVELAKSPDGYELTFVFGPAESAGGDTDTLRREMELSETLTDDSEAVWVAEQELQDIFGRIPSRDDRQPAPLVAIWSVGG